MLLFIIYSQLYSCYNVYNKTESLVKDCGGRDVEGFSMMSVKGIAIGNAR